MRNTFGHNLNIGINVMNKTIDFDIDFNCHFIHHHNQDPTS
jgi:hypothetical protein